MKSLVSDLLVWGSKHSTERRQDEPSRPPTAYSLRKTEDGAIFKKNNNNNNKTPVPQKTTDIAGLSKSLFNLVTLRQMVQGCVCVFMPTLLGRHNPKQSLSVCVCTCIHGYGVEGGEESNASEPSQASNELHQAKSPENTQHINAHPQTHAAVHIHDCWAWITQTSCFRIN